MSYCRWSSEDWSSDVYVYEHVYGGWTTHVARSRHVFNEPLPPTVDLPENFRELPNCEELLDVWVDRYNKVMGLVDKASMQEIDLPHAGETFSDLIPQACADRLLMLRSLGYHVPQSAIDRLQEEAHDESTGNE